MLCCGLLFNGCSALVACFKKFHQFSLIHQPPPVCRAISEPLLDVEPEPVPGLDGEVSLSGSKLSSAGSSSPNSPKLVLISCRGSSSSSCGIYRDIFWIL
jgi:hypothetical protein